MNDPFLIAKAFVEASGYRAGDFRRLLRPAKKILERSDGNTQDALERIRDTKRWADHKGIRWSLWTVLKMWNRPELYEYLEREELVRVDQDPESLKNLLKKYGNRKDALS